MVQISQKSFWFWIFFFLWSHWLFLFWTSCVLPYGFQIQSGYLACTLPCLHAVILKVTSGATPTFSTNRGEHCISVYMAWWLVAFPTCHVCNRGRLLGFDRETSRVVSGHAVHSATATGLILNFFITYLVGLDEFKIGKTQMDLTAGNIQTKMCRTLSTFFRVALQHFVTTFLKQIFQIPKDQNITFRKLALFVMIPHLTEDKL